MKKRWLLLVEPPDYVAADIAVNGVRLEFLTAPPLKSSKHPPAHLSYHSVESIQILNPFILDWLERDIITTQNIPTRVFWSRLFHVPKADGRKRPVLDLSALNLYIKTPGLKMEHLGKILPNVWQSMWATTLDIVDAFLAVLIAKIFRKYFCFYFNGQTYMFLRMPFGLTIAPWAFSRLMRPVKSFLRTWGVVISSFIDDFLNLAITKDLAAQHNFWTRSVLTWLGFRINEKKSQQNPCQILEYLGVLINFKELNIVLPKDKVEKVLALTHRSIGSALISRRQVESVVGLLMFAHKMIPLGRMHVNKIITWQNRFTRAYSRDTLVQVNQQLIQALAPFKNRSLLSSPQSFRRIKPSLTIMTDASGVGWSGVILPYRVSDTWTSKERTNSINVLELTAMYNAVNFFKNSLQDIPIRFISLGKNEQSVHGFSFIVSRIQHTVCCGPHCGTTECSCRQGLTSRVYQHREYAGPRLVTIHMGQMAVKPMARRIRYFGYYEMSFVRLSVPGSESLRHRCVSPRLERLDNTGEKHLFLPSTCVNALLGREICGFQRQGCFDSAVQWSHLASASYESSRQSLSSPEGLLPISICKRRNSHTHKEVWETGCVFLQAQGIAQQSAPIPTTSNEVHTQHLAEIIPSQQPNLDIPQIRNAVRTGDPNLSRLEVCFNEFLKLGYSPDAAYIISNSHKASTKNQYQSGWKLWLSYLQSHNIPNEKVNAVTLCNFLVFQGVQISRALSTLKVYYYSIRKPFKLVYNTDLPPKEDLDELFNGIYHLNPPPTKEDLAPKWDLTSLLNYLRGEEFEPLSSAPVDMVEIKAFILILIATGRRVGEISSATFDKVKFIGDDKVELGWSPTFRVKAQRSKSSWSPANPSFSVLRGTSDDLLCPVRAFRAYYEIRCSLPHDAYGGYLWTRKLKQISNLVRDTIIDALKQFQPDLLEVPNLLVRVHQLRKFVISLAKKFLKVSDDELCKLVGSRTIAVPYRRYT